MPSTRAAALSRWPSRLAPWLASAYLALLTLMLPMSPLLASVIVRTYGWWVILNREGAVNSALLTLGLIDQPLVLLRGELGIVGPLEHLAQVILQDQIHLDEMQQILFQVFSVGIWNISLHTLHS